MSWEWLAGKEIWLLDLPFDVVDSNFLMKKSICKNNFTCEWR